MVCHSQDDILNKDRLGAAWRKVQDAHRITLLTHFKPDGDGIAACAALEHLLLKKGKTVETIYPSAPEFAFTRQPKTVYINEHRQHPDLIIICDTANYDRAYYPDAFKGIPLINIDHHVSNSIDGVFNFVAFEWSSTCELLYLILKILAPECIDTTIAELLLYGILYDSQIFQTQATTAQTLTIAAELMYKGADLYALKTELIAHKDPHVIALWGKVLSSVVVTDNEKAVYAVVRQGDLQRYKVHLPALVGFHNFLSHISLVDVSVLFYEMENGNIKCSLRSKRYDVNAVARQFGGGGHKNAAGFISQEPIDTIIKRVVSVLL